MQICGSFVKNVNFAVFRRCPGQAALFLVAGTNRRHRIPAGKDEKLKEIHDAWIKVITRDRVVDDNFHKQIDSGNVYVCERHFKKEEIDCREY